MYGVALGLLAASTVSLQSSSALATSLFNSVPPIGAATLRLGVAAVILAVITRPAITSWSPTQWGAIALLGLAMAGMNSMFYAAIERVPLGIVATVEMLGPLLLAGALSRRARDLAWVGVAMVGVIGLGIVDSTGDSGTGLDPIGLLFAAGAAVFLAGYIVTLRRVSTTVPGIAPLSVSMGIGAIALLPVGGTTAVGAFFDLKVFVMALAVAVFGSIIPYVAELIAARSIPTRDFGVLTSREPVFASLIGFVALGQQLTWAGGVAMAAVVAAAVATALSAAQKVEPVASPVELVETPEGQRPSTGSGHKSHPVVESADAVLVPSIS